MGTIPILYEDNHLLVVVKPPNLLSQADRSGDEDLLTLLKNYIKRTYGKPGRVYLGLVHRLDRPVGGVMVFAKTSKAARRLAEQIRGGAFQRGYLAAVWGHPQFLRGSLQDYLLKDGRTNMVTISGPAGAGARQARLDYEVVDMTSSLSLVRIWLQTGRSHQIRVQMAHFGHPLFGDQRYGKRTGERGPIGLWAEQLGFQHPTTSSGLQFTEPPPPAPPWNWFKHKA